MVYSKHRFLISRIMHWRLNKKHRKLIACPNCNGNNIELLNQIVIERDYFKAEEFLCYDCDCEWDWTFQRSLFGKDAKIRKPKWAEID